MFLMKTVVKSLAATAALLIMQTSFAADDKLIDSAYAEFASGTRTQMLRAGVTSDWSQRWFQSNGTHLSGYWDASAGAWRGNRYQNVQGATQNLYDIGFTPVFRFERDDKKGFYAEGGIGVHMLSKLYDNDDYRLSTHFQFGDHIGVGYVFDNKWELGMKIQHFSNGGYKKPNTGVNFLNIKASYHF
ncbi:acyloxyacyl hydrolase [Janthinobacterium sp.]|uniref:acyloxyacyl hydrolase n=1 Tax=Janthinobacterium sp. TaxID=1871054 RepID=UPI003977B943